jgi:nickel-dependent lactate racemase
MEADCRIAVGEVSPDHFAGLKGAQSTIMPALASREALIRHREIAFQGDVVPGVFEGNPAHSDQMEACELSKVDLALNLITDGWGRIASAVAGGMEPSWKMAVEKSGDLPQLRAEADADIIVVSAGGDRFDFDLYNAVWALRGIAPLVKKGATIILLAECTQGLGAEGLESLAQVDTLAELRRRYILGARAVYAIKSTLRLYGGTPRFHGGEDGECCFPEGHREAPESAYTCCDPWSLVSDCPLRRGRGRQ